MIQLAKVMAVMRSESGPLSIFTPVKKNRRRNAKKVPSAIMVASPQNAIARYSMGNSFSISKKKPTNLFTTLPIVVPFKMCEIAPLAKNPMSEIRANTNCQK